MLESYLIGILILLRTFAAPALVRQVGPDLPESSFNHGTFRFAPETRRVMHDLWEESVATHQERLACIAGYRFSGTFYVTRAQRVTFEEADSLHLVPDPASCASPEWHGTVHTHIARFQGLPFVTFSYADRMMMTWWRQTWKADGAFCVIYSAEQAYCELAANLSGDGTYSSRDPIEEMYYAGTRLQPAAD